MALYNCKCSSTISLVNIAHRRVLTSWIGQTDLRALAADLPPDKARRVLEAIKGPDQAKVVDGPIRTLLRQQAFDEIHLLSNYDVWASREYVKWLGVHAVVHFVDIDSPVDYPSVFKAVDRELAAIAAGRNSQKTDLCIHLSSGTPAMAAIWVLLGKSKYPATFWQTYQQTALETDIPFDLTVDFLPQALRNADAAFHHLMLQGPSQIEGFQSIVGDSPSIRLAVGRAQRAALRDVPVLVLGESGTGKELMARAIHAASSRKNGPCIAVNCAAIPAELLESELFGHTQGAFTGANKPRDGAFKQADHGILFLDEIGECAPAFQAKLLRVLQPPSGQPSSIREFQPIGSTKPERSDVRIIAATNRNLVSEVASQHFREDLYYRLAAITIQLPPLRDRKPDIPAIAASILAHINHEFAKQEPGYRPKVLSPAALAFAKSYPWPGNVRQLHNALLQASVMAEHDELTRADLEVATPSQSSSAHAGSLDRALGGGFSLQRHLEGIQVEYLARAMQEAHGVKTDAARLLGYDNYQTLDSQLKRLRVRWEQD